MDKDGKRVAVRLYYNSGDGGFAMTKMAHKQFTDGEKLTKYSHPSASCSFFSCVTHPISKRQSRYLSHLFTLPLTLYRLFLFGVNCEVFRIALCAHARFII
jgi:hypothetical protein